MAMRFVEGKVFRAVVDAMDGALRMGAGVHGEREFFQRFVTNKNGGNWLECEAEVLTPGLAVFKVTGWGNEDDDDVVFAVFAVMSDGKQHCKVVAEKPTFSPA